MMNLQKVSILLFLGFFSGCSTSSITARSPAGSNRVLNSVDSSNTIGSLNWGNNPQSANAWSIVSLQSYLLNNPNSALAQQTQKIIARAKSDIASNLVIVPVAQLNFTGTPPTDPRHIASQNAINQLPHIFGWAVCARLAQGQEASDCLKAVNQAIIGDDQNPGWIKVYSPTGDPINEARLMELFLAMDWALPVFAPADQATVKRWLANLVAIGDSVYNAKGSGVSTRINNFNTWRLAIRSVAAKISGHANLIAANPIQAHRQIQNNLIKPSRWAANPACSNDSDIDEYVGYDFRQRDALTYHQWNLQGWINILLYCPENISMEDRGTILNGFNFLKPYFLSQKTHIEFVCSTVPYDAQECAKGDTGYCHVPWVPASANTLLREARPVFSEIQNWTSSTLSQSYSPTLVFRAELMGN